MTKKIASLKNSNTIHIEECGAEISKNTNESSFFISNSSLYSNEEINDIICEFKKTQYENKTKSENSVIIDNYLEQEIKKNDSNNLSSNTDCIIS